ncbi:hypothetical protein TTHERM_00617760 (macronuclear) [Tetrahymena thermophila SB210]|uniref:Uncharacterized protein n=1 Tax=Tetrahymena thermophila (strain SB210) TaxID=312017 RepID=Q23MI6_TETTS|nr:hypothetical protein TTHERM_00617760 [Tetrahymena thermophila SB210]EAR97653.1 hypothetical protein TTHERM_00617760 [Tetrahymena thermophila SB210]|eukprot:XP_001017898.1 hypothetical protein TTHERM_00617760 [Tetrahymena thermophila SB210]
MGYELRFFNNIDLEKQNVKSFKEYSKNLFTSLGASKKQIEKRIDLYLIYPCLGNLMNFYGIKFRNVNLDKKKSISLSTLEVKIRMIKNQDSSEVWKKKFQEQGSFIQNINKFPLVLSEKEQQQPQIDNQKTKCYYLDQASLKAIHNTVLNSLKQSNEAEVKTLYQNLSQFSLENSGLKLHLVTKKRFMKGMYVENTSVKLQRLDQPQFKYDVGYSVCIESQVQGNVFPKQGYDLCCGFPEYLSRF